ncbi:MAG: ThuA domain-containing protein [Verrucomicrobiales bacterium]
MKTLSGCSLALVLALSAVAADWVVFDDKPGPGKGKHVVLLAGDEEYRSEEGLPMLAKILSQRHGFKCTVLFPVDPDGTINPDNGASLPGSEALDSADAVVMLLRFRHWKDDAMERFEKAYLRGVPLIALRTSTHAFNFPKDSRWSKWTWNNEKGGFGKIVLGETWVSHWGDHKKEAARGIIEPSAKDDPILRGVSDLFGDTDVYEAAPPADAKILVRGQVLTGMKESDPPAKRKKKTAKGAEQDVNEPMMPLVWTRWHQNEAGKQNKILCTTMGSATDLQNEGLRRLVINGVFWALGFEVPARADVTIVGNFQPSPYGFKGAKKGVRPADHELPER